MRRALRWLFHLAAAASLLACIAGVAMWTASHWAGGRVGLYWRYRSAGMWMQSSCELRYTRGAWIVECQRAATGPRGTGRGFRLDATFRVPVSPRAIQLRDTGWTWRAGPTGGELRLVMPYAALVLPAAVLPCAWWRQRRRVRAGPGHCRACGYDLRGSPGAACPECGAAREASPVG